MRRHKRVPAGRLPHPDPEKEIQLQAVQRLVRLGRQAEDQLRVYQKIVAQCDNDQSVAVDFHQNGYKVSLEAVAAICAQRREAAENGIREQRDLLLSLGGKIDAAIRDSGLAPADLAFLDLSPDN